MKSIGIIFAMLMGALIASGCGRKAGEIFPPLPKPLVWPEAPETARVRYVGQLSTSADLKPAVPFGQDIGEAFFGKKPVKSMLTPYALCTDGRWRLFVADSNAQLVHVFDLATRKYAQWMPATANQRFSQPVGIAHDSIGWLYVSDSAAGCIYVFNSLGKNISTIGREFVKRPCGLAFDDKNARLFVADAGTHEVIVLSREGRLISRVGSRGTEVGQFNYPTNVALDSQGRLYVSDSLNFRVQQFSPELAPIRAIGRKGDMPGYFSTPKGIAVDNQDHLYVVDANFESIQIFDSEGKLLLSFGQEGRGPGEFWLPAGIFIDPHNRIWVADAYNRRVQVFEYLPEAKP